MIRSGLRKGFQFNFKFLRKYGFLSLRLTVKDLQELDNLDNSELKRFLEESNREVLEESHSVALAEWVNDRKLVFESPKIDFVIFNTGIFFILL